MIPISWPSGKSPRVALSSCADETQSVSYVVDTSSYLKSLVAGLLFGKAEL